jgi:hypothetical protein
MADSPTFTEIDVETLQNYEGLLTSYMNSIYPTLDVSNGSVIHELLIRPAAVSFANQDVSLTDLKNYFSLNYIVNAEDPDEDLAEDLAANFNVTRKDGTKGTGVLALYTNQTADVYIAPGTSFTAGGEALEITKTYVGTLDTTGKENSSTIEYREMQLYQTGVYVFSIPVQTVESTSEVVEVGTAVTVSPSYPQITGISVLSPVSGGTEEESVQEMADRVVNGISAKVPSGNAHIQALFEDGTTTTILSQKSFGLGDAEMLRDRNNSLGVSTGGSIDTYCKTSQLPFITTAVLPATKQTDGSWLMNIDKDAAPGFYGILSISYPLSSRVVSNQDEMTMTYRAETVDGAPNVYDGETARYSIYQAATVSFDFTGITSTTADFTVSFITMPELTSLQTYILNRDIRNPAQDVLVKAPIGAFLGISMGFTSTSVDTSDIAISDIQTTVANFVNGLPIGTGTLKTSDLSIILYEAYPTLRLDLPVSFRLSSYMPDGTVEYKEEFNSITAITDEDQGVTTRNTAFFCEPSNVDVLIK